MPKDMGGGWMRYKMGEEMPVADPNDTEDMGETFRAWTEFKKRRRREALEQFDTNNAARLIEQQTSCKVVQKSPYHYHILDVGGQLLNYWPSARKWRYGNKTSHGAVESLIGFINNRNRRHQQSKKDVTNAEVDQELPCEPQADAKRAPGEA